MRNIYAEQAAFELAEYFASDDYRDEVQRQSASQITRARRQRSDFGLAKYWRDIGYGHASNVAAASLAVGAAASPKGASGVTLPTRRQDNAA